MANTNSINLVSASAQGAKTTTNFTSYGTSAVTFECWFKSSTDNAGWAVVVINDGVVATLQIQKGTNIYRFYVGGLAVASPTVSETLIEDGTWHHLAGVYDGSNIYFYLDSISQGTPTAATGAITTANPTALGIGLRPSDNGGAMNCEIDEVRVWNTARTQTEIANNYKKELLGTETGLTFYWKANNSVVEETGNYAISLVNAPSYTTDVPFTGVSPVHPSFLLNFLT